MDSILEAFDRESLQAAAAAAYAKAGEAIFAGDWGDAKRAQSKAHAYALAALTAAPYISTEDPSFVLTRT